MTADDGSGLFPGFRGVPDGVVVVNERCRIQRSGRWRVVTVSGIPVTTIKDGDQAATAHAMVTLIETGCALQVEVARAFGCDVRTVRRHQRRYESGGLAALGRPRGFPQGRSRVSQGRIAAVEAWKSEGVANREIARRLGVDEKAIRKLVKRLGWEEPEVAERQVSLPFEAADPKLSGVDQERDASRSESENDASDAGDAPPPRGADPKVSASSCTVNPVSSSDRNPADRVSDRLLARLGLLDDAAPVFGTASEIPGVGVLLAMPALVDSGILSVARQVYGSIGPAFYGLRTTFVTLLLMALLRVKRPEGLKERSPRQLGQILGLDRAPEVKTLRAKLSRLAAEGQATSFGRALARHRVAARGHALGFLYVDGHVRAYHGKRTVPKTHVARMRIAMPATTDYWIADAENEPLFVVPTEANRGIVTMLPAILAEVRTLLGDRRATVVFDRGGWSPKLFAAIVADGFDILTYRRAPYDSVPLERFSHHEGIVDGRNVAYVLADEELSLGYGRKRPRQQITLRQITHLADNGHQTPIITSRRDLSAFEIAHRIFDRWRQENFFKYLREEFALDALVDYATEPADAARQVPNPERKKLSAEIRKAKACLQQIQAEYGLAAMENPEGRRPTMRGFKIANAELAARLRAATKTIDDLETKRAAMPTKVPVREVVESDVVKLLREKKHLTDLIKMIAYQAEGDLLRLLTPHYRRAEQEGRTLLHSALSASGDISVSTDQLRVDLNPLSSPHKSQALAAVCQELNRSSTCFPGTSLKLTFFVKPDPPRSSAFPGPIPSPPAPQPDISRQG